MTSFYRATMRQFFYRCKSNIDREEEEWWRNSSSLLKLNYLYWEQERFDWNIDMVVALIQFRRFDRNATFPSARGRAFCVELLTSIFRFIPETSRQQRSRNYLFYFPFSDHNALSVLYMVICIYTNIYIQKFDLLS